MEQYNNSLTSPCVTVSASCETRPTPCVTVPAPCVAAPASCVTIPTSCVTVSAPSCVNVPIDKNSILCIVCGKDIKTSKERRKLFQKDSKTSLCLRLEKYVKASISLCFQYIYTNYICRTCIRLLEHVEKLETKLRGKFEATIRMFEAKYGRKKRVKNKRTLVEPRIGSAPIKMDSFTPLVSKHSHMPPLAGPSPIPPVTMERLTPSIWQHSHRFARPLALPSFISPVTMQNFSTSEIHSAVTAYNLTSPVSVHDFSPSVTTYGYMYKLTSPVSVHGFNLSVSKDSFTPSAITHCITPSVTTLRVTPSVTTHCVTSSVTMRRSTPQVITRSTPPEILLPLKRSSPSSVREPILRQALKGTVTALPVMHKSLPLNECHTPPPVKVRNWLLPVTISDVVSSATKSSLSVVLTDARAPLPREPSFLKSINEGPTFLSPVTEAGCRERNFTTSRDNCQHGAASGNMQPDFSNGFTNGNG